MIKSIFISKNPGELQTLNAFCSKHGIQLEAHSFLHFSAIPFEIPRSYDVIFFSSPRALMFFKSRLEIPKSVEIACVGETTETLLRSMGHPVAFSGAAYNSIHEVADAFQSWLEDRVVLFPVSSRSLGTISTPIPPKQKVIVECYETQVKGKEIDVCEAYVFTSPSNVEGFLEKNEIPKESSVIAWGKSTEKALLESNVPVTHTLSEPTTEALIRWIETVG